jgi:hypothetical protein
LGAGWHYSAVLVSELTVSAQINMEEEKLPEEILSKASISNGGEYA